MAGSFVALPRLTVDFEALVSRLLIYPGLTVLPRLDSDSLDDTPLLEFTGAEGRAVSANYPDAGQEWTLLLTLWADSMEQGGDVADTVYQLVHALESQFSSGVGAVNSVEDVAMFNRTSVVDIGDRTIVQYDATFTVVVSPA